MKQSVYGQDEAIDSLVESICKQIQTERINVTIGSLFVGPTGTGKIETSRTLAKELEAKLIKFDMRNTQERHSVSKLIGAPPLDMLKAKWAYDNYCRSRRKSKLRIALMR